MPYKDPYFEDLLTYWKQLALDAGGIPTHKQFNPFKIPHVMPNLCLLERTGDRLAEVRVAGSGLDIAVDYAFKAGDDFSKFTERDWTFYIEYCETLFAGPYGASGKRRYRLPDGRVFDAESVNLPLGGAEGFPQLIINMSRFKQNHMRAIYDEAPEEYYSVLIHLEYFDIGYGIPENPLWVTKTGNKAAEQEPFS